MSPEERARRVIREALQAARPELKALAKRAGIKPAAMYQYSTGRRVPDQDRLRAIASALRQQAGELLAWAAELDAESNR